MKKVEAQVRKERLAEVENALRELGVPGLTVVEEERTCRGTWDYPVGMAKHLLLTVVVDDEGARRVVESIRECARTGSWSDGRISVTNVENVVDISSGRFELSQLASPSVR